MLKGITKKGSYIVEATIVAPIMIIGVLALISIIPIIDNCQSTLFSAADEIRLESAKMAVRYNPLVFPAVLREREIAQNDEISDFHIIDYRYKFKSKGINDLIGIGYKATFREKNPLGLFSNVVFENHILARGYTGKTFQNNPSTAEDFEREEDSRLVYIFPTEGKKYHSQNCSYVKSNCQMKILSKNLKKSYYPCSICKSKGAPYGSTVFVFTSYGSSYHLGSCKAVDKYYIKIEKEIAIEKGYTPCKKCGGE